MTPRAGLSTTRELGVLSIEDILYLVTPSEPAFAPSGLSTTVSTWCQVFRISATAGSSKEIERRPRVTKQSPAWQARDGSTTGLRSLQDIYVTVILNIHFLPVGDGPAARQVCSPRQRRRASLLTLTLAHTDRCPSPSRSRTESSRWPEVSPLRSQQFHRPRHHERLASR
jgi:hypothetical protein